MESVVSVMHHDPSHSPARHEVSAISVQHTSSTIVIVNDVLSPRLMAEPWRQEERCVRAGENESPRRLSSAVSPVYSTRSNMHFDTTGTQHSFVHSTTMSPLYESPLRSLLETANRPDADDRLLSHIEMSGHENSNSKEEQE